MALLSDPENDRLVFAVSDVDGGDPLVAVELAGRADLDGFYDSHVGYGPGQEPGGPMFNEELIADVAANILHRLATDKRI